MNINIIRDKNLIKHAYMKDGRILEETLCRDKELPYYVCRIYDPSDNTVREIAPEIIKYEFLSVENCIYNSKEVYFATYEKDILPGQIRVLLYRYDIETCETERISDFEIDENIAADPFRKLRLFVLQAETVLVQIEEWTADGDKDNKDGMRFEQFIINIYDGVRTEVKELNVVNNGINTLIPVSESQIVLKTGFSFKENTFLSAGDEALALVETVYFGTMSGFIAMLPIENGVNSSLMLSAAYFEKLLTSPKVTGDYIHFMAVDHNSLSGETVFYNYKTDETIKCQSMGLNMDDLDISYVIDGAPCIRREYDSVTEFVDARDSKVIYWFSDEKLICCEGQLFIFRKKKGKNTFLRGYRLPKLDLAFEETGNFMCLCAGDEDYYIYVK